MSGPAGSAVANSALAWQFPAGQRQRFVDRLRNNGRLRIRLLAGVSAGRLRRVFVVFWHSMFFQFGLETPAREANSFPEVACEEAA
jgi:hypothetical protein